MSDPMSEPTAPAETSAAPKPAAAATPASPVPGFTVDSEVHLLDPLAVMIQGYSGIQNYQAQARILIENERSTVIPGLTTAPDAYYEDPEPYYQTQHKILKGRDLARRVSHRLKLETV